MDKLIAWLVSLCMVFAPLQPYYLATKKYQKSVSNVSSEASTGETSDEDTGDEEGVPVIETTEQVEESEYAINNFVETDFEGYATIALPQSHFTLNSNDSTATTKYATYKDNRTRLVMGYISGISDNTDLAGYIMQEIAGVNSATNNKSIDSYGNNVEWVRVKADTQLDGCNVYIFYSKAPTGTSAFWIKATVEPGSDNEEFLEVMGKILDTYNYYMYSSGTLFDTPTSGYYKDHKETEENDTKVDTSKYVVNDKANTVFSGRGGYVKDAKISANWKDLQVIIDGHKYELPSKLSKFEKNGFKINNINSKDELIVYPNTTMVLEMINSKGTIIKVEVANPSGTKKRNARKCDVVSLKIDRTEFITSSSAKSSKKKKKKDKNYNAHELIIAGGVTWDVYTDDLIEYLGNNMTKNYYGDDSFIIEYKSNEKHMTIIIGDIHTIESVKISCIEHSNL